MFVWLLFAFAAFVFGFIVAALSGCASLRSRVAVAALARVFASVSGLSQRSVTKALCSGVELSARLPFDLLLWLKLVPSCFLCVSASVVSEQFSVHL